MTDPSPPLAATGWSSSLSVAEHAAIREAGFVPKGLVMGSSVFNIGVSYSPSSYYSMQYRGGYGGGPWAGAPRGPWAGGPRGPWAGGGAYQPTGSFPGWFKYYSPGDLGYGGGWAGTSGMGGFGTMGGPIALCWERVVFEEGIETAAGLAVGRILAETKALGAHGVVGTRLSFRYLEGFQSTIEFTALGTAVVREGVEPLRRPFTSHLDGQALLKLLRAGMVPVTVVVGAGSVTAEVSSMAGAGTAEIVPYGEAIETSRRIAGDHLQRVQGANGWAVLGTLASTSMHGEGEGRVMTTVLTGTVVRRFVAGSWDRLPLPIMRLSKP